jgi:hypothetical protein
MLNKIKKSILNSVEQDLTTNKTILVIAICMPLLVLQDSPTDIVTEVIWWAALIILVTTILYIIFAIYIKFTKKIN